jgi:hypothetical protein
LSAPKTAEFQKHELCATRSPFLRFRPFQPTVYQSRSKDMIDFLQSLEKITDEINDSRPDD